MRILLVTKPHLPIVGGGQMTVHWLALALADRGHEVSVLAVSREREVPAEHAYEGHADPLGYPIVRIADPSHLTPGLLAELSPDVALLNGYHSRMLDWGRRLLDALRHVPTALYLHDARGVALAKGMERVAAVSRFLATQVPQGAVVIPPIVEPEQYRIPTARERALFVNPVAEKGLATALELADARPDIPFVFQRAWPLLPPALASLRREVARRPNVELRDPHLDPRMVYRDARVLLVPSTGAEAWGRVAREAQASGIPVVAARIGGLPEAVGAGGVLVDPGEGIEGWLRSLAGLWDEPLAYAELVERAERQAADPATAREPVAAAVERLLAPLARAQKPAVFLVGARYPHHARHSGYDRLADHLGPRIRGPVRARKLPGRAGTAVDRTLSAVLGRPRYSVSVLLTELAAATHMLRRRNTIFHVMYGDRDLLMLPMLGGRRGNRVVATFHGPLGVPAATPGRLSGTLDAAILVAEYQRAHFESLLPDDRIFVVRHGVDSDFFRPGVNGRAGRTCISVGSHQRDFETLVRTVERVWSRDPHVRFKFAGVESPQALGALVGDERVELLGRVSDEQLRAAYRSADVALFAFREATASNSLLEAMACGLPLAVTDVGGVSEYVNGEAAHLCPPGDADALAEGVVGLLDEPDVARRMGAASRGLAEDNDYRRKATELRDVYSRVLELG